MTNDCELHVSLEADAHQSGMNLTMSRYKSTNYNVVDIPNYPKPMTLLITAIPTSELYWPLHGYLKYTQIGIEIFTNRDGTYSVPFEFFLFNIDLDGEVYFRADPVVPYFAGP